MNRREFTKLLSIGAVSAGTGLPRLAIFRDSPTIYYVDGYHGGIEGHMPPGAWRDVLNTMRVIPGWKLGLEIEPASWDVLRRGDPASYEELRLYAEDTSADARVEMLSVTFAQPYGWAIGGESNVRQLMRGIELTRRHFPDAVLETYAVQEPCWTSCLPQILMSLGFKRAVLKNPGTAWGGYAAGIDAETVHWVGPDGTMIPTVPRYACEDLVNAWETESVNATPEFAQKCVENGIEHPAGMCFQDLGWSARPRVSGDHVQYVTWREYFEEVVDPPEVEWAFGIEDSLVTLPWGEQTIQTVTRQVRSAETRLLMAEKLSAMAWLRGRRAPDREALLEAWDSLMWAQHHDSWITATTRSGRDAWAFLVASWTLATERIAGEEIDASFDVLANAEENGVDAPVGTQYVEVTNTLSRPRQDLVELTVAADRGTHGFRVEDDAGRPIPAQVVLRRRYDPLEIRAPFDADGELDEGYEEESLNAATLLFRATVPAMGAAAYRLRPMTEHEAATADGTTARREADGTVVMESDLYLLRLDPRLGGAVTSLIDKQGGREIVDNDHDRRFHEFRGYFVAREEWASSADAAADISIVEAGPVRAKVGVEGTVGEARFRSELSLAQGAPQIDVETTLTYEDETWIGDPWDIEPENRRTERRKSHHDSRWKLQAFFPTKTTQASIYKNAAYDVTKSRLVDTFFQRWDEIKHNIILDWVDEFDEASGQGLAVFSDHATSYSHGPNHPLALVLAWGWEAGFWWGKQPLEGVQRMRYAVVPHTGRWDEAELSFTNARWKEPLLARIVDGRPQSAVTEIGVEAAPGIEIPTMLVDDGCLLVRTFNAEAVGTRHVVTFRQPPTSVEVVELDGRRISTLEVRPGSRGAYVEVEIPRFGLRTLRCTYPR